MVTKEIPIELIQAGPRQHEGLSGEQEAYARWAHGVLGEVYPVSWEAFVGGFLCDTNPSREIAVWHVMAERYLGALRELPGAEIPVKKDIFRILLASSMGYDTDGIVAAAGCFEFSPQQVRDVADRFGLHKGYA